MNRFATPPDAAARVVVTATLDATIEAPPMYRVEPGLKPYQPTQRKKVPKTTNGMEWPLMGPGFSPAKRPMRGPSTAAPMPAAAPPTMCTTPQPAKSTTPTLSNAALFLPFHALSQPGPLQTQCTTTGYTKPVRNAE